MHIRPLFETEYIAAARLIHDTVHTVCRNDYSPAELSAWAPESFDMVRFHNALTGCFNPAMFDGFRLVGFMSVEQDGYINRLFTHKDYQRRGIASALLAETEKWAKEKGLTSLRLDSSKTACGFYLKHGFVEDGFSVMERNGIVFRNTVMKKTLLQQGDEK